MEKLEIEIEIEIEMEKDNQLPALVHEQRESQDCDDM